MWSGKPFSFSVRMHQKSFFGRASPALTGRKLQHSRRPSSWIFWGREGREGNEKRKSTEKGERRGPTLKQKNYVIYFVYITRVPRYRTIYQSIHRFVFGSVFRFEDTSDRNLEIKIQAWKMDIKKAFAVMKSMQFVEVHECGLSKTSWRNIEVSSSNSLGDIDSLKQRWRHYSA